RMDGGVVPALPVGPIVRLHLAVVRRLVGTMAFGVEVREALDLFSGQRDIHVPVVRIDAHDEARRHHPLLPEDPETRVDDEARITACLVHLPDVSVDGLDVESREISFLHGVSERPHRLDQRRLPHTRPGSTADTYPADELGYTPIRKQPK